jgi:hypothetical protein
MPFRDSTSAHSSSRRTDGGAGSGLEDYWNVLLKSKVRGGAFLWTFVDEAVKRVDLDGRLDGRGNLAPDGILGPYREKEASYFTYKEVWSPVVVAERKLPVDFNGTLTIENRYDFLDAQKCGFSWQLRKFRRPDQAGSGFEVLARASTKLSAPLPPGVQGRLKLGLPKELQRAGKSFSLVNGPRLAAGQATLTGIEHRAQGPDHLVTATYSGNMKSVRWRVRSNDWVQLDYAYNLSGPQDFFGVSFDYPEANVKKMTWLGGGPYRVWNNRRMGETFNVWENQYNNSVTGAGPWIYPEFKGYFDQVRWVRLETSEGPITAIIQQDDLFLQILTPQFPDKKLAGLTSPPFPSAGISFLHAIPGMGSKFISSENSGPQARKTIAAGDYQGSVSFYFGK